MTQDVLKYLQPNAAIPIDMETTSLLVNALKKALSEHAMQEVQRLGQEIEQEPVPECPNLKGESMNKDEALTLEALKFAASNGYGRIVHEMKITPFTIKYEEALAQPEQEPVAYLCENAVGHRYFRWKKPSSTYKPIALYTSPPQRTWVGLTDDEKNDCLVSADPCEALAEPEARQLIEDVEQALKERNQ